MKIAFTATGTSWDATIDPRFGRTDYLVFYDEDKDELTSVDNREIVNVAHGAGPKTAQLIYDHTPQILITGNGPGGNAAAILNRTQLRIYLGAGGMTLRQAYTAYKENKLPQGG